MSPATGSCEQRVGRVLPSQPVPPSKQPPPPSQPGRRRWRRSPGGCRCRRGRRGCSVGHRWQAGRLRRRRGVGGGLLGNRIRCRSQFGGAVAAAAVVLTVTPQRCSQGGGRLRRTLCRGRVYVQATILRGRLLLCVPCEFVPQLQQATGSSRCASPMQSQLDKISSTSCR